MAADDRTSPITVTGASNAPESLKTEQASGSCPSFPRSLQTRKSRRNSAAYFVGGPDQVRTDDLLNAIEALFQLSYEPVTNKRVWKIKVWPVNASVF